jgi:hypothetical protein
VHEEIELVSDAVEMIGCRHLPSAPPVGAVLVCSAGPFDAAVDRGRVARLARRLAADGLAVQRLHPVDDPPGGDARLVTFASLVDGAERALERLRAASGDVPVALVGARLGALVAARLARRHGAAPVAVWEPALDPLTVLERAAAAGRGRARPVDPVVGDPVAGGAIDLVDTPLAAELVDPSAIGGLLDELGPRPRPLLLVQTSDGGELSSEHAAVVERGRHAGIVVDVACHTCDGWRGGRLIPVADPAAVVDDTAAWLGAQLVPDLAAAP